jgi:preprotein translocase subunit YajC
MFISPAYAQGAGGGGGGIVEALVPLILIFAVFYFLLIRPQQKKMKAHREMVQNVQRGDNVVTAGGIIGRVAKVVEGDEILVEIAENVRVRVLRSTLTAVVGKTEPAAAEAAKKAVEKAVEKPAEGEKDSKGGT